MMPSWAMHVPELCDEPCIGVIFIAEWSSNLKKMKNISTKWAIPVTLLLSALRKKDILDKIECQISYTRASALRKKKCQILSDPILSYPNFTLFYTGTNLDEFRRIQSRNSIEFVDLFLTPLNFTEFSGCSPLNSPEFHKIPQNRVCIGGCSTLL